MRAILLCAGKGERLKPITNFIPKCLVPINGRPLLDIWIEKLIRIKVKKIFINTHHLHNQIRNFLNNHKHKRYIELFYEKKLLDTAGTLKKISSKLFNDDCLLIHADNYCEDDLINFLKAHYSKPKYCYFTMMLFKTKESHKCGIVKINKYEIVEEYYEKKRIKKGNLANAAIYALSSDFILNFKNRFKHAKNFSTDVIPLCLNKIYTFKTKNIDIGSPENYKKINQV